MEFGEILRELLDERSINQKEMALALNLAPSTLSNYVRGLREPDFQTMKIIADYFQVTTDYLLDHHPTQLQDHMEDRLLHLYRSMSPKTKELYLEMGALLQKHSDP